MVDKYGTGQDPYCYKGTDILINNFDIRDKGTLQNAEREFTTAALNDIEFLPPPYDLSYLQDLHRLLFSISTAGLEKLELLTFQNKTQGFALVRELSQKPIRYLKILKVQIILRMKIMIHL